MGAKQLLGRPARAALSRLGYGVHRTRTEAPFPPDFTAADIELFRAVQPYTLTSRERVVALRDAVRYVAEAGIEGAIVECGVWRGGSMLVVAGTLVALGDTTRDLYLYDTFTQMPPPGDEDVDVLGTRAADVYEDALAFDGFANLPVERVRELMEQTGYPPERLHLVAGMVEETIPGVAPEQIALCRLDTDWYASTKHEMEHLAPRVVEGGVLIIDDYGHFQGSRQAVDEYFDGRGVHPLLVRVDWTGRLVVVTRQIRERLAQAATASSSATRQRAAVRAHVNSSDRS
jgi:O-methyltransferase